MCPSSCAQPLFLAEPESFQHVRSVGDSEDEGMVSLQNPSTFLLATSQPRKSAHMNNGWKLLLQAEQLEDLWVSGLTTLTRALRRAEADEKSYLHVCR